MGGGHKDMSKTIDEKVVEMRFDNKQFESNVATSMSTLEKLKRSLKLDGAAKGLEDINGAAKKVDMSGLGNGVESVSAKFSALQVIGVTALANITNSAVNAGKRMVSALTIDPVLSGFKEYETQINSVQTILANTSSKGTTIDDVTAALDELNHYADLTIYNFTEMTRNIGTFTAAGIDLDTSVNAIQGIANLAAVSGSTSQQASVAMYQLSQALASGTVKLMDWNSVVNAGMGGEVFQNALKETSELLGTGAKAAIEAEGSFRESLRTGWLTSEVLTETLKKFTTSGANEYVAKYTGLTKEAVQAALDNAKAQYGEADAIDKAAEALANKSGKNKDEIKSILQMAKTATEAATKVKTFSQLWDVLKEAAQSGWAKTWQIIIGDFEEAKALLTPISDTLTNIINKMSDWRNSLLESALGKGFSKLGERITGVLKPIEKVVNTVTETTTEVTDTITNVTGAVGDLGAIVDKVILGEFGNGLDRFNALTEAGENYYRVQNKVNETLNNTFRYSEEQIAAQDKLLGNQKETVEIAKETVKTTKETVEATSENKEETVKLTDAQKDQIKTLAKLSDEQLRSRGYTEEQIKALNELRDVAEKLGIPLDDFIDNLDEINGRWLLMNSFKNIGKAIAQVFTSIGKAWRGTFDPIRADSIFDAIAAFHKMTTSLIPSEETAKKLTRTFKGLFAVLDVIKTVVGGGINVAFKVLSAILNSFHLDILDVTAGIGDALVAFHDWVLEGNALSKAIKGLVDRLPNLTDRFKEWFATFKETPVVEKLITAIKGIQLAFNKFTSGKINLSEFAIKLGENLAKALKSLPDIALQIGKDFIAGFQNGIDFSISGVIDKIVTFCLNFIEGFKKALGVHSPSWKAFEIAQDFFQGFINGAKKAIETVTSVLKTIGEQIIKVFKGIWDYITDENGNIEWGKIFAGGIIVSMLWVLKQLANAFSGIANALGGFDDLIANAARVLKNFSKVLNGIAWNLKAKALLKMAIAISILVAAILVLTQIDDPDKLWQAVGVIAVLATILVALSIAMAKLSSASVELNAASKKLDVKGIQNSIIQIGLALLLVAASVKLIGEMNPDKAKRGFLGLAGVAVAMIAFIAAIGGISTYSKDVKGIGSMMKKMAVAIILMAIACKLISTLSAEDMLQGVAFVTGFTIFVISITKVAKSAGNNVSKVGGMAVKLAIAMALLVGVCKLVNMLSAEEMFKGAAFAAAFVLFVKALVFVTKIGKKQQIAKLSGLILSISISLMLMVGVCKLVGKLTVKDIIKGTAFVAGFVVLVKIMMSILKVSSEQKMAKVAGTILAMSLSIAILAGVAALLSFIDLGGLAKGIIAVGLLSAMMAVMIKALKGAQNVKASIMMIAISIGVMAASIVALSFIDTKSLLSAAGAMTTVMTSFALIIRAMSGIKTVKMGPIIAMVGLLAIFTGIIAILSRIDPSSAMTNVLALTLLMSVTTGLLAAVSLIGKYLSSGIVSGIASLTAMAIPMWAFIQVVKQMNGVEDASEKVRSLTIMMAAMGALLAVLAIVGLFGPAAIIGIGSLVTLFAAIGALAVAIGYLMDEFPSIQKFLDKGLPVLEQLAGSIGTMIGMFISAVGEAIGGSLVKIGMDIAAFMSALSVAGTNASTIKADSFNGVKELVDVLSDIASTTVKTSISDIFTLGGTSMEKFQTDAVAFFTAMKSIGKASSGVNINAESMNSVIGVAQNLANLQSSLEPIGGVISWFSGRDDLATFGANIGEFVSSMISAFGSIEDSKINIEAMNSMISAATSLSSLQTSLEPIGGVVTWFSGRDDLGRFGINVYAFVASMKTAFGSLEGTTLNTTAMNSIISAATSLSTIQSSLGPIGGVITWFSGRNDLAAFGANIGEFVESMKTAFMSLDGVTINSAAMNSIVSASTSLATLQTSLEPIGGVVTWFSGRDDLGRFGINVSAFIASMKIALSTLEGATLDEAALTSVVTATTKLAELQSSLEPMGGVVSWFTGRSDLGTFGINIGLFAEAIGKLKIGLGENGITEAAISSITNTGTALVELQKALPEEHWFDGKMNLSDFSNRIDDFASAMSSFGSTATEINTGNMAIVISSAYRIKSFIESLGDLDNGNIDKFKPAGIAKQMKNYFNDVAEIDTGIVSMSIISANKIKDFITSLSGMDTSGVSSFASSVDKLSEVDVSGLVEAFSATTTELSAIGAEMIDRLINGMKSKMPAAFSVSANIVNSMNKTVTSNTATLYSVGGALITKLTKGILSKKSSINSAISSCLSGASSKIRSYYSSFYNGGSYLVTGFCNGITNNTFRAKASVEAMAEESIKTARKALRINSPSKVFKKIGSGIPEGFAMGIDMLAGEVTGAVSGMAFSAINTTRSAMSTVLDAMNTDMDTQPTIRPVVDLSDVQTGADAINGMLNGAQRIGVQSNLGAIGSTMNALRQNGNNDDIIYAINKLRDKLDGIGNTYNTVNGLTYDDGSNVTDAVETLVRYAKIGRRV
jgi:tape measure domain-containing protein